MSNLGPCQTRVWKMTECGEPGVIADKGMSMCIKHAQLRMTLLRTFHDEVMESVRKDGERERKMI